MRLLFLFCLLGASVQAQPVRVVTDDLDHFWIAADAVAAEPDSTAHAGIIEALYLAPGTPGLAALVQRRGLTATDYAHALVRYPQFWTAVRRNSDRAGASADAIREAVAGLRTLYPALRPATVYFTMGALTTNGMTLDSAVFIGSELAFADPGTPTDELPARLGENLRRYFDTDPSASVPFLAVHEIVHTQQGPFGETLLAASLQEGVAEFLAVLATGTASPTPGVAFLRADPPPVLARFETELFSPNFNGWLYNDTENAFGVRDLGYAVGYRIAELSFNRVGNKQTIVREMIELDYADPAAVEDFVEASRVFSQPLDSLRAAYTANQPRLASIAEFENGARDVDPSVSTLTLTFSVPMDARFRTFDAGPLAEATVLRIQSVEGWSTDGRTLTLGVALEPGRRYQLVVGSQFRAEATGAALDPVLIDIETRTP